MPGRYRGYPGGTGAPPESELEEEPEAGAGKSAREISCLSRKSQNWKLCLECRQYFLSGLRRLTFRDAKEKKSVDIIQPASYLAAAAVDFLTHGFLILTNVFHSLRLCLSSSADRLQAKKSYGLIISRSIIILNIKSLNWGYS